MSIPLAQARILIVDDLLLVRALLARVLTGMGTQPERLLQATDGNSAIRVIHEHYIDAIVCDVEMTPMNGLELLAHIRAGQTATRPNIPFVFLSCHDDPLHRLAAEALLADGFLAKPLRPADIEAMVWHLLSHKRPRSDPLHHMATTFMSPPVPAVSLPSGKRTRVGRLRAGDLLTQNLVTADGRLLLAAGHRLTRAMVTALQQHHVHYGLYWLDVQPQATG
ncbi:response regulator [Laribacter hongkongensis]|uniref:DNA-binding response regulator n=2 Tax=Laribacter hongkongensis TaxID=168471 RepID=C1D6B1_LARHH|nr:response regulator [Laribacter hongkongensis]ACO76146.1 DNA-binding response regulator [Laribacter hongkongensis HLHK9]MCG8996327.1 response regulator [Laribacter hongkongensis]MCG9011248.1 response regulator [Laribacter hongkongensis]MCG9023412.1 response regulator [Laribacter hongkongensis]MCG9047639.1 response regulator [Laribacter hongkongensis]